MNTTSRHRYACILLDDAFKLSVCTPEHEDVLRGIIELLIPGKHVGSLILRDKEQHGLVISDKNATFDLYCTDKDSGEQFIVEMQMEAQASFRDRALSYANIPSRSSWLPSCSWRGRENSRIEWIIRCIRSM